MTSEDARRWDERYRNDPRFRSYSQPREFLKQNFHYLPAGGLALDVAMGLGGNAAFLLAHGWSVVGVDISAVAVRQAKRRHPKLMAVIADMKRFNIPPDTFDLILNFYYLQRGLWPAYKRALRPGGILIFESLTREMLDIKKDIEPSYLLAPGELKREFADLEIIVYREGWTNSRSGIPRAVASLIARRISDLP